MTTDQALLGTDEATSPNGRHFRFKVANAQDYPPAASSRYETPAGRSGSARSSRARSTTG